MSWLDPFNSPELGYEAFVEKVGAVVLGRATYEQSLTFGPWPYPGRQALIVTSRPISNLPPLARAVTPDALPDAVRAFDTPKDRWIVGGGKTARSCLDAGLIDELELYVVPRPLGTGVPLFAGGPKLTALRMLETRAFGNGIVMQRYSTRVA